jgi:molybdopterin synthase sulfur carrier subunit
VEIMVRYFANIREQFGRNEDCIEIDDGITVSEVWQRVSNGDLLPKNTLIAVNMEYVEPFEPVKAGDEVAFFPPITGG